MLRATLLSISCFGFLLGGCQAPPKQYAIKPDLKALAETLESGRWLFISQTCDAERAMRVSAAECEAQYGESCQPAYIGPYLVRGKTPEQLRSVLESYQTEYDQGASQIGSEPRQQFFHFVAAIDSGSEQREMDHGTMTITFAERGCGAEAEFKSAVRLCTGQSRDETPTSVDRLFPQFGTTSLDCDDGRKLAGNYTLLSFQYGRAELTGDDGSKVRAIFSTSSAVSDMGATGFDAAWNREN